MRNATRTTKTDARGTFGKNGWSNIANLAAVLEAPAALKSEPKAKKAPKAEKTGEHLVVDGTLVKVLAHADGRAWLTVRDGLVALGMEGDTLINATDAEAAPLFAKLGKTVSLGITQVGMRNTLSHTFAKA